MEGFIKLYRKFINWEWHDNPEVVSLFIHLLVMAQHTDFKYHGKVIKRGQLQTSIAKLSKLTGLTERKVRTCLTRLETTNEIASKTTNRNRTITICNYDSYQGENFKSDKQNDKQNDKQVTNHQTRMDKNDNNNIVVVDNAPVRERIFNLLTIEKCCMTLGIDQVTYLRLAEQVLADWDITEEKAQDMKHFLSVMRIKVAAERKQNNGKKSAEQIKADALAMAARAMRERIEIYGTNNDQ